MKALVVLILTVLLSLLIAACEAPEPGYVVVTYLSDGAWTWHQDVDGPVVIDYWLRNLRDIPADLSLTFEVVTDEVKLYRLDFASMAPMEIRSGLLTINATCTCTNVKLLSEG